jgi:hypothetical protein
LLSKSSSGCIASALAEANADMPVTNAALRFNSAARVRDNLSEADRNQLTAAHNVAPAARELSNSWNRFRSASAHKCIPPRSLSCLRILARSNEFGKFERGPAFREALCKTFRYNELPYRSVPDAFLVFLRAFLAAVDRRVLGDFALAASALLTYLRRCDFGIGTRNVCAWLKSTAKICQHMVAPSQLAVHSQLVSTDTRYGSVRPSTS